jgi:hypothetical protein
MQWRMYYSRNHRDIGNHQLMNRKDFMKPDFETVARIISTKFSEQSDAEQGKLSELGGIDVVNFVTPILESHGWTFREYFDILKENIKRATREDRNRRKVLRKQRKAELKLNENKDLFAEEWDELKEDLSKN